jgi:hypothetical protein
MNQRIDLNSTTEDTAYAAFVRPEQHGYYAVVPSQALHDQTDLLDKLISFAFDTLGARHFELRVQAAE